MYTIDKDEIDETLPEAVKGFLRQGYELHKIHLDARGKWTHEDLDFENPRIIDAFNRGVAKTEGGSWVLELGRFTYPIIVEDTGFFVERIEHEGDDIRLFLSDDTSEILDPTTVTYEPVGRLYCRVKEGDFRARFKRSAYYQMSDHFIEDDDRVVLEIGNESVDLASLDELEESGD